MEGGGEKDLSVSCNNGIFVGKKKDDVISFKGIPFAKPPIGELRWKDPILAEDNNKIYEAYYFGKAPIQTEWIYICAPYCVLDQWRVRGVLRLRRLGPAGLEERRAVRVQRPGRTGAGDERG